MSIETEPFVFLDAIQHWAKAVSAFMILVIIAACGLSLLTHGRTGPVLVLRWIPRFFRDLLQLSPRRVFAIAQLTFREAVRRKALVVFGMFALLFMFGSWFMDNPNERMDLQVKNYISFVLTAITWLLLPVVLLISCWGLPEDIRNRSLHTVVTKPARKTEIVIGRMLGFSSLMTILVVIMGVAGYVWIDREVAHNLTVYSEALDVDGHETLVEYVDSDEGVTVRVTTGDEPTRVTTAASRSATMPSGTWASMDLDSTGTPPRSPPFRPSNMARMMRGTPASTNTFSTRNPGDTDTGFSISAALPGTSGTSAIFSRASVMSSGL